MEATAVRTMTFGTEQFEARSFDPYGFWEVKLNNAKAQPKELKGKFTSMGEVEKAIKAYITNKTQIDPDKVDLKAKNPRKDKE